ncbi:MAG TPA: non-ribosomal peptide synthetase [Casimicrobiaceae bacterium]|nr:non-ribosomal peptide synthetase [Casimicrobiaceae bacterium]
MLSPRSASDPPASLLSLVEDWAQRTPEGVAIAAPGRAPLTYRRLAARLAAVGAALAARNIGAYDRVALALRNGPEMAVAFLGVASAACCAPLNPACRASEASAQLAQLGARALIAAPDDETAATRAAESLGIPVIALSPRTRSEAGAFELEGPAAPDRAARPPQQRDEVALVLQTSGTTSQPKIVPLTQANLCASARNVRAALGLTARDRCLGVMPLFHVHGLVGALLGSLAAGASVVCTPGFYATEFFEWLDEFHPTWYTAVPSMHQAIVARAPQHREVMARAPLRFVRSCSSALSSQVATALETEFATAVVDAYGMTEAAHQIASTPLGKRKPGSVGVAAGTEIAIIDAAGERLPAGAEGEIAIRGANVMRGYEGAAREAFAGTWLRTGDLGRLDGDGYLFITGRLKEIINRGGTKISPVEVEEALLAHSAVQDAAVFPVPHPELGEEPAAAAVLRAGATASERELRAFVAERVADFKVPRHVTMIAEIPRTATGKPRRAVLAQMLATQAHEAPIDAGRASPATPLEALVADIWRQVLKAAAIGVHDDFFQLGGDSILAARILARVRQSTNVEVSFLVFQDAPTVAGMASAIDAERAAAAARRPRPGNPAA